MGQYTHKVIGSNQHYFLMPVHIGDPIKGGYRRAIIKGADGKHHNQIVRMDRLKKLD